MKKIFTLLTVALIAMTASAQKITFPKGASLTEWSNGDFKITATDTGSKLSIDENSAYFGTPSDYIQYETRLKSGGKSSSNLLLTLTIPTDGTLKISARTGSNSATDRNIVLTQDGSEILNKILLEADKVTATIDGEEKSVYPVVSVAVKAGEATLTFPVGSINFYAFELVAGGDPEPDPTPGDAEKYEAISWDGTAYTVAPEFSAVVADPEKGGVATNVVDGKSVVKFSTANVECEAVGGTTAKTCDATGVTEWNDIKWDWKNQGDILFGYINGTGNPVFGYDIEEIITDDVPTGNYRQKFDGYYYTPDCGKMPAQGLYYKFTAKTAGDLKIYVWSNKGNRNTYLVDEATTKPVTYAAEGYINGQNGEDGKKKWLSAEEIQAIHVAAFEGAGKEDKPYVIGAGNQNYWGAINYTMTAGQTVWLFQDSSQIGFQGYEFTSNGSTGIQNVAVEAANSVRKVIVNGKVVIVKNGQQFNLAGQLVK